jgi:nitrate/nitrite transporter NarK
MLPPTINTGNPLTKKMRRNDHLGLSEKGDTTEVRDSEKAVSVSRHAWFTLAILSSTLLTVFFSETMLLPALPEIIQDFNISYGTAAWIFSAYLIVAAVMTPVAGRLSDLYGKKKYCSRYLQST